MNSKFKIVGTNSAGLTSKLHSFDKLLNDLKPSVFCLQETKMKTQSRIKTENSRNYTIYELLRKSSRGGGLAIGVHNDLNSAWVSEGDDDVELLVVEVESTNFPIRIVNAYGPQENDSIDRKQKFWSRVSQEVEDAMSCDRGFIMEMDGNLHVGNEVIPGDPNSCNQNGKLFKNFLKSYSHLKVVNSSHLCSGIITRIRKTIRKVEEAVLDFFVVCDRIFQFIESMIIDEHRNHVLTNFNRKNTKKSPTESDHNPLELNLSLTFQRKTSSRMEIHDLKSRENQETFHQITSFSEKYKKCFKSNKPFNEQAEDWKTFLFSDVKKSFNKIRISNKVRKTETVQLMEKRMEMKQKCKIVDIEERDNLEIKIEEIEDQISRLSSRESYEKVKDNFGALSGSDGSLCSNGIWKLKKKIFPKKQKSFPVVKKISLAD